MSRPPTGTAALGVVVAVICANGCHKQSPPPTGGAPSIAASASAPPVDRLAPGELLPGEQAVYGLVLPHGMVIGAAMPGVAHATGPVAPEDAANYIRDRVDVRRVELGAVGTVFRAVHILAGDPSKVYRIEVNGTGAGSEIVVRDVTPQPTPLPDPKIDDAERWHRAGYGPNGRPLDPMNLR